MNFAQMMANPVAFPYRPLTVAPHSASDDDEDIPYYLDIVDEADQLDRDLELG